MKYWSFGLHRVAFNGDKGQNVGVETVSGENLVEKCATLCDHNRIGCKNFELSNSFETDEESCLQYEKKLIAESPTHVDTNDPRRTGYYKLGNISNCIACRGPPRK